MYKKMLENRPNYALGKLVNLVKIVNLVKRVRLVNLVNGWFLQKDGERMR